MNRPMPKLAFNMMSCMFRLRDLLLPRAEILKEAGIEPGFCVLDYGCGPGGYIASAAELAGKSGKVYALDIHPLAVQRVQDMARKRQLVNVETIYSNCETGLPDSSVDVALLHDIFHMLSDPQAILAELHRVLKRNGVLSLSDPHMGHDEIISGVTNGQLFRLLRRGERTYSFVKQKQ